MWPKYPLHELTEYENSAVKAGAIRTIEAALQLGILSSYFAGMGTVSHQSHFPVFVFMRWTRSGTIPIEKEN